MLPVKSNSADLEQKRVIFLEIGIIISLLVVYFGLNIKIGGFKKQTTDSYGSGSISEELVPITIQESKPPPPLPPPIVTGINVVDNSIDVVEEIEIDVHADQETVLPEYVPPIQRDYQNVW